MAKNLPYCGKGLWKLPDEIIIIIKVQRNVGPLTNGYNNT